MGRNFEKAPPLPMLCELEQTTKTNTGTRTVPRKKMSVSYSSLASYVGYLAGVCRLRCASVWQSVQQHSRTGPQPGSIFHPRNVGIRARGNGVVNCSSSGHALRRAQTKQKNVIEQLQPQDESAGARAPDERCQSPSSLTAEHARIGGISWAFTTGQLCCSWVGCWGAGCLCVVLCCFCFVVCCVLCVRDPRKYTRAPFQVIVRRGMRSTRAGCL